MLRRSDLASLVFALFWNAFATNWVLVASQHQAPHAFIAFAIPFIAIGLYMLIGRFFYDAWRRKRTVYGLSDHNIIISGPRQTKIIDLASLSEINLQDTKDDRSGTIVLGSRPPVIQIRGYSGSGNGQPPAPPMLEGIKDVNKIFALIQKLRNDRMHAEPAV